MRVQRLFLILSTILLSSTFFAPKTLAQNTSVIRYGQGPCPENITPNGKYNYPTGIKGNSLDMIVDPSFQAMMKKTRSTPDLPLTPIYDLIVQIVPQFGFCYTDKPSDYSTTPPSSLPWKVSLQLNNEILVGPGTFVWNDKYVINPDGSDDKTQPIYEWKIKGWPDGIASKEKLEKLITATENNIPADIVVEIPQNDGTIAKSSAGAAFGLCAPIAGNGSNQIAFVRGQSAGLAVADIFKLSDDFWSKALVAIQPYKSNVAAFSIITDLGQYPDGLDMLLSIAQAGDKYGAKAAAFNAHFNGVNACPGIRLVYSSSLSSAGNAGIAFPGQASGAIINPRSKKNVNMVSLHEFSHTFAGLNDEYPYKNGSGNFSLVETNCSRKPDSNAPVGYIYDVKTPYGSTKLEGCSLPDLYRPSNVSIMNDVSGSSRFNVVSCGYILAAIKGGEAYKYWPDCKKMGNSLISDSNEDRTDNLAAAADSISVSSTNINPASSINDYTISEDFSEDGTIDGQLYSAANASLLFNASPSPSVNFLPITSAQQSQKSFFQKMKSLVSSTISTVIETVTGVPANTPKVNLPSPKSSSIPTFNTSLVPAPSNSPVSVICPANFIWTGKTCANVQSPSPTVLNVPNVSPQVSTIPTNTPKPSSSPLATIHPTPSQLPTPSNSAVPVPSQIPIQSNSPAPSFTSLPSVSIFPSPSPTPSVTPTASPSASVSVSPNTSPSPRNSSYPSPSPSSLPTALTFDQNMTANIFEVFSRIFFPFIDF